MSHRPTFLLVILVFLSAVTSGCRHEHRECNDGMPSQEAPVDPALMAFLSRARAAHHDADLREDDPIASIRPLLKLVEGPIPTQQSATGNTRPAEVREVLADTQARIADLESLLGRFEDARRRIDEALKLVPEISYFRGHLYETRGVVAQRESEMFAKSGRPNESADAKARALEAFESAMDVQAQVIRQTGSDPAKQDLSPPTAPSR